MPIPPVIDLSDEECPSEGQDAQLLPSLWRKKRKRQTDGPPPRETMESQLKVLLGKRCVSCRHNCMQKFSEPAKFETLVEFKRDWLALHKLDQDQAVPWVRQLQDFVFDRIRQTLLGRAGDECASWIILGTQVCLRSWKRLHGVGAPEQLVFQWEGLRAAAENGSIVPPVDLRYLKKGQPVQDRHGDCARGRIVSFLESVYHGQAETLPDVRDNIVDVDMKVIDVQVVADPYVDALNAANPATELPSKKEGRKQHQRLKNKSVQVNTDRSQLEERFLPPGTMMDYYELMKAAEPDLPPVSFSSFWRTWKSEFTHLKFRAASSHAVCAICLKHKMWIQEMSGHARARTKQRELYSKHLQSQYMDRVEYWTLRSSARLRTSLVVMMIDSCDQAKFCYPRGMVYQSKELASLIRPRAHITAILVHGRKGFLSEAVPVALSGIAGPGAPHVFQFDRRESLGCLVLR
ncbi:FO synthase subunit 1 [Durusdinium trenchii]|uniref:FO synthase subunit 1 n=1 Tax=Durusdinium trenchii TaxID=1381693 RepID=A0ABP0M2J4_9DINO